MLDAWPSNKISLLTGIIFFPIVIINTTISSIVIGLKTSYFPTNQNYNKILERDWLSAACFEH